MGIIQDLDRIVERVMSDNGMTATNTDEWISTGRAAHIMGYKSRDGFRLKFLGIITAMKLPSGHYRWSNAEVLKLRDQSVVIF